MLLCGLSLFGCRLLTDASVVVAVAHYGATLRFLDISLCYNLTLEVARALCAHCSSLQEVRLAGTQLQLALMTGVGVGVDMGVRVGVNMGAGTSTSDTRRSLPTNNDDDGGGGSGSGGDSSGDGDDDDVGSESEGAYYRRKLQNRGCTIQDGLCVCLELRMASAVC